MESLTPDECQQMLHDKADFFQKIEGMVVKQIGRPDKDIADQVFIETFLIVVENTRNSRYVEKGLRPNYFMHTARLVCTSIVRQAGKLISLKEAANEPKAEPDFLDETIDSKEIAKAIAACRQNLTAEQNKVFEMLYLERIATDALVAEILNVSRVAVTRMKGRIRETMLPCLRAKLYY